MPSTSPGRGIRLTAVGDVSFQGKNADTPALSAFSSILPYFSGDANLVIANLENPVLENGAATPGKCTLRGAVGWADVMKQAGIRLVSLANNHMMDYGAAGLSSTIAALEKAGIDFVGAGENRTEALAPVYIDHQGQRIAFLARSDVFVASHCFATDELPGVAFFDLEETRRSIAACRRQSDLVVLLLHWGLEHYLYPSPGQRRTAAELISAGAGLILGHHPHVLQGTERIGKGLVCYSQGNFLFDEVEWSLPDGNGNRRTLTVHLSAENRRGGILGVEWIPGEGITATDFHPTFIRPEGLVAAEDTVDRRRHYDRLCSRLHWPGYGLWWRLYSLKREMELRILPLFRDKLTWRKLRKLRLRHFRELRDKLRRSARISAGKSKSPYDG